LRIGLDFTYSKNDHGAAAIEFAILAPIFLMLAGGIMAYGIYFGAAHSLQQLAADAARTSIAGLSAGERDQLVEAYLDRNAPGYVLIDRDALSYSIGGKAADPNEYSVTLSYDASRLPIWNLYPPLPLPSRTIRYSSSIRLGGI
jgi:Flp pilus assembly protein TadG